MIVRDLEENDFNSLAKLITSIYEENRLALWFENNPTGEELASIFAAKIIGMREKVHIDIVAVENEEIVGECEIAKKEGTLGVIGVIVKSENRRKGIGNILASDAIEKARAIGISDVLAEVAEENLNALSFFYDFGFEAAGNRERGVFIDGVEHRVLILKYHFL